MRFCTGSSKIFPRCRTLFNCPTRRESHGILFSSLCASFVPRRKAGRNRQNENLTMAGFALAIVRFFGPLHFDPNATAYCWGICTGGCLARCCGGSGRCRCRAGNTAIAVAKSGADGGGSEQCLRDRLRGSKRGSLDGQERAVGTPVISLGPALVRNS